jgi:hypothetical protein
VVCGIESVHPVEDGSTRVLGGFSIVEARPRRREFMGGGALVLLPGSPFLLEVLET